MGDKERIAQLEEELAALKANPSADFYTALVEGVSYITTQIKTKKLNLSEDPFADSIVKLAEKSDKIFSSLEKGLSVFDRETGDNKDIKKKKAKEAPQVAL